MAGGDRAFSYVTIPRDVAGDFVDTVESRERERVESVGFNTQFEEALDLDQLIQEVTGLSPPRQARGLVWDNDLPTALTAPLFYDQPLVFMCSHCELVSEPELLRWMGDRGLVIPVLQECYHGFEPETVAVLAGIPHVSSFAAFQVVQAWGLREGAGCLGTRCTAKGLVSFSHLDPDTQRFIETHVFSSLLRLPTTVRDTCFPIINDLIEQGNIQSLRLETAKLQRLVMLSEGRALQAVPQLRPKSPNPSAVPEDDRELLATTLGIAYSPSSPPRDYLEVISSYRGSLAFLVEDNSSSSLSRALDLVDDVNSEVAEIRASRRLRLLRLGTRVFQGNRRRVLEAIISGTLGTLAYGPLGGLAGAGATLVADIVQETIAASLSDQSRREVADRAMAAFFGTSLPAVQVWHLQESLSSVSGPS